MPSSNEVNADHFMNPNERTMLYNYCRDLKREGTRRMEDPVGITARLANDLPPASLASDGDDDDDGYSSERWESGGKIRVSHHFLCASRCGSINMLHFVVRYLVEGERGSARTRERERERT